MIKIKFYLIFCVKKKATFNSEEHGLWNQLA